MLGRFHDEAQRRGVDGVITDRNGNTEGFVVLDRAIVDGYRVYLISTSGWQYYSTRHPVRFRELRWLFGSDDAGLWARRVPVVASATVNAAVEAITPAAVRQAQAKGRRVRRQGDVYAVETTPAYDGSGVGDLPTSHRWNPATRYLTHTPDDGRKHRPIKLSWPVRFIQQNFGAATFSTD